MDFVSLVFVSLKLFELGRYARLKSAYFHALALMELWSRFALLEILRVNDLITLLQSNEQKMIFINQATKSLVWLIFWVLINLQSSRRCLHLFHFNYFCLFYHSSDDDFTQFSFTFVKRQFLFAKSEKKSSRLCVLVMSNQRGQGREAIIKIRTFSLGREQNENHAIVSKNKAKLRLKRFRCKSFAWRACRCESSVLWHFN